MFSSWFIHMRNRWGCWWLEVVVLFIFDFTTVWSMIILSSESNVALSGTCKVFSQTGNFTKFFMNREVKNWFLGWFLKFRQKSIDFFVWVHFRHFCIIFSEFIHLSLWNLIWMTNNWFFQAFFNHEWTKSKFAQFPFSQNVSLPLLILIHKNIFFPHRLMMSIKMLSQ